MQKKRLRGSALLDKLHRGAVYTCLGVTLYGTFLLGMRAYRFYTVVKPEREKAELQRITEAQSITESSHDSDKDLKY